MRKILMFSALALAVLMANAQGRIDLSGEWRFGMGDASDCPDQVTLPGSMLTNGKGQEVSVNTQWVGSLYDSSFFFNPYMAKYRVAGQMKFPFFLTPERHYVGTAWYARNVTVPKSWHKQHVFLYLERPHIETAVFVNGHEAGRDSSLSVPHVFDVTPYVNFGGDNEISIRVYNGIENVCVGQDSHSVTDQTQGDWNGIIGRIELQARPLIYINNVQVYPDVAAKAIDVRLRIAGGNGPYDLRFNVAGRTHECKRLVADTAGVVSVTLPMGDDVLLWDEFSPNLYTLTSILGRDTVLTSFGMRDFTIRGRQFYVNDRPVWMRGTVENCCFPLTGYPPTDEASWLAIFNKCKEYGLNMMRFHSYCPPEAAFAAADEVGFYLQPEGPSWPNHGVRLGRGMSIDRYLLEETERMVEAYGNHPSFCMLAAGNEPAGDWVTWTGRFVEHWQQTGDRRRVYCGASVGGGWAWDPKSEFHVKGGARGLDWDSRAPQSVDNFNEAIVRVTQKGSTPVTFNCNEPYLSHEMGQWCAFPDLAETSQYTGVYKARNFEIFADLLRDGGMASMDRKFLMASGRLQTLAYKYDIERNLRTRDYAGFQALSLNDYSGQGTALVGVLNVFWREKGYCDADRWVEFCSPVVPLAKFPKFVYTTADTLRVDVELYNAYSEPLRGASSSFTVTSADGRIVASGNLRAGELPLGKNIDLGRVELPLARIAGPQKLTLAVMVEAENAGLRQPMNTWEFWVYPETVRMPDAEGIYVTDTLDAQALATLAAGGRVLIEAAGKVTLGSDVKQTYLPVFWNTSWFKMRPPHTTGCYIDTSHPLFRAFPTDDWGNLNWWELLNKAQVMNLCELPADYQPPIQPIDTWHVSRKLAMLIEANVGGGRLVMTTMDLSSALDKRVVARQMRKALLEYMSGDDFHPALTLEPQVITDFFEKQAPAVNMFTNDSPDELKPKLE